MHSSLPPKRRIKNFSDDDIEGKWLFMNEVKALNSLFHNPLIHSLGVVPVELPLPSSTRLLKQPSLEMEIQTSLQRLYEYHEWINELVGASAKRGEEVPTMSYFVNEVERRKGVKAESVDDYTRQLKNELE